ncbi:hypothetical protein IFM89_033026 [Coptis chinensis]|uniref:[phosphatase 2A protein]-leucine-carboxy methyltransferase n=1 Tax=Coptis chinensis TaxID=261450 RepID=A0A835IFX7_9MAGN|nr:hypothetical protein IFM89_033026 [Coptis chinensis]
MPVRRSPIINREKGEVLSDHYKLLPVDLREIPKLDDVINLAQLDRSLPTFIIAECVLIYLDPDSTRNIVSWASRAFSTAIFFIYEQIHPDDAFGQQMMMNLEGASKKLNLVEWEKQWERLWTINKEMIHPECPRHTTILEEKRVLLNLMNGHSEPVVCQLPRHGIFEGSVMHAQL